MKNRRHNDDVFKSCYAQDLQIPFVKQNVSKKSLQHQLSSISFFLFNAKFKYIKDIIAARNAKIQGTTCV